MNIEIAIKNWLQSLNIKSKDLFKLGGDASFRQYYRVKIDNYTRIVMYAPPETYSLVPYLTIAAVLKQKNVRIAQIFNYDLTFGLAILEDFGQIHLVDILTTETVDEYYQQALEIIIQMQNIENNSLAVFDEKLMFEEMLLSKTWFLHAYLNMSMSKSETKNFLQELLWLAQYVDAIPKKFMHKDFHCRNLMYLRSEKTFGVIDFQDALIGPVTYDLVSLLKDCYITWPQDMIHNWLRLVYPNFKDFYASFDQFVKDFDLCGLQRHIKVLGIFCRLYLRDQKPNYLKELPRLITYISECLQNYNIMPHLQGLLNKTIMR